jgi:hypothetical protein
MMQKTTFSLMQWAFLAAFSVTLSIHAADKPQILQSTAQSMKNAAMVLKYNPQTTEKIDSFVFDTIDTIDRAVEKIEKDIPKEERKAAEAVIKEEFKEAKNSISKILKKHADKVDQKITEIIGEKQYEKVNTIIAETSHEISDQATQTFNQPDIKELGKELDHACKPIKHALDSIDEAINPTN